MEWAKRPMVLAFFLQWKIAPDQFNDVRGGQYFLYGAFRDQSHMPLRLVILLPLPIVLSTAKLVRKTRSRLMQYSLFEIPIIIRRLGLRLQLTYQCLLLMGILLIAQINFSPVQGAVDDKGSACERRLHGLRVQGLLQLFCGSILRVGLLVR